MLTYTEECIIDDYDNGIEICDLSRKYNLGYAQVVFIIQCNTVLRGEVETLSPAEQRKVQQRKERALKKFKLLLDKKLARGLRHTADTKMKHGNDASKYDADGYDHRFLKKHLEGKKIRDYTVQDVIGVQ